MSTEFKPQYHFKNAQGHWQMRPFDPRLATLAAAEAKQLTEAGEVVCPLVDEGAGFQSPLFKRD